MRPDASPGGQSQPGQGLKIFIDFWDVANAARDQSDRFRVEIDWKALIELILRRVYSDRIISIRRDLAGCYISVVTAPSDQESKDSVLHAMQNCAAEAGIFFDFIFLPDEDALEPGGAAVVGVGLAVEMIRHAALGQHDHLVLVSNRPGFLPLLRYLRDQGQRVVHVATGAPDDELRCNAWRQIEMRIWLAGLCTIDHDRTVALVGCRTEHTEKELRDQLDDPVSEIEIIDLSDPASISDKDLLFLILNRELSLRHIESGKQYYSLSRSPELVTELRQGLGSGVIAGHLPYVMRHGRLIVRADGDGGWVRPQ